MKMSLRWCCSNGSSNLVQSWRPAINCSRTIGQLRASTVPTGYLRLHRCHSAARRRCLKPLLCGASIFQGRFRLLDRRPLFSLLSTPCKPQRALPPLFSYIDFRTPTLFRQVAPPKATSLVQIVKQQDGRYYENY